MLKQNEVPSPALETTRMIADAAKTIRPDDPTQLDWFSSYALQHQSRLALDLEMVRQHAGKDQRLLEYGAIPLLLTAALREDGYNVTGLDIAPERFATAIARLHLDVRKCDVEHDQVPFPEAEFDVVIFNEIFEHLRINLIFTLTEVRRVVKRNGLLLLSTPNLRSLGGLRNLVFRNLAYSCSPDVYSQYEKLATIGHMGHVREYTSREVCEFLDKLGFTTIKIIRRGVYAGRLSRAAVRIFPSLRPFISIVAVKR